MNVSVNMLYFDNCSVELCLIGTQATDFIFQAPIEKKI
jgi:hypothetical protein